MANTVSAGHDYSFGEQQVATSSPSGASTPRTSQIPVSLSNTTDLDSLDVTVNIVDPSDQFLGLILIAPSGDTSTFDQVASSAHGRHHRPAAPTWGS